MNKLLEILKGRKGAGITRVDAVINFIQRRIQPIKERAHLAGLYSGLDDPTRELAEPWLDEEIIRRVRTLFAGDTEITNEGCPSAFCRKKPADEVR